MSEIWIEVRNWRKFQHYHDRVPTWIKNNLELMHDDNYRELTMAERGVLHGIWLEYASARRALRGDTASISRRFGKRVTSVQLKRLEQAGFITLCSRDALAFARSRELLQVEVEIKKKNERAKNAGSREPEQRHVPARQNAGGYTKHHTEEPADTVPIETIEAYLMGLQTPHFTDGADD